MKWKLDFNSGAPKKDRQFESESLNQATIDLLKSIRAQSGKHVLKLAYIDNSIVLGKNLPSSPSSSLSSSVMDRQHVSCLGVHS